MIQQCLIKIFKFFYTSCCCVVVIVGNPCKHNKIMADITTLNTLLRKTFATSTPDEVAFVYYPKDQIDSKIFNSRFGESKVDEEGVTYSLTKSDLLYCFAGKTPKLEKYSWSLVIPPCAAKNITSIVTPSIPPHKSEDQVTVTYIPEHASKTKGMTVVHFYDEMVAEKFKNQLEEPFF